MAQRQILCVGGDDGGGDGGDGGDGGGGDEVVSLEICSTQCIYNSVCVCSLSARDLCDYCHLTRHTSTCQLPGIFTSCTAPRHTQHCSKGRGGPVNRAHSYRA